MEQVQQNKLEKSPRDILNLRTWNQLLNVPTGNKLTNIWND